MSAVDNSTNTQSDRLFPTLSAEQLQRLAAYGTHGNMRLDETLMHAADPHPSCFVVLRGSLEILRVGGDGVETSIQILHRGQFTGEANLLTGRSAFVHIRANDDGEVLALDRDQVLRVLQLESDISQIVMRAFILRRAELIARGYGDAVLVGRHFVRSSGSSRAGRWRQAELKSTLVRPRRCALATSWR